MEEKKDEVKQETKTTSSVKRSGLTTAGFICSLLGFITCGITSIVGLILSIIGYSDSKKNGKPDNLALAGIIISAIPVALIVLFIATGKGSTDETSNNSNTSTSEKSKKAEITYTAIDIDTLEDALSNNAAAAKDTYNKKYLEITGRLGTIDSDLKYISLLSTTNEWDLVGVHCTIRNSETKEVVKSLTKGQTIIVKGKITDVGEVLGYYLDIDEIIPQ